MGYQFLTKKDLSVSFDVICCGSAVVPAADACDPPIVGMWSEGELGAWAGLRRASQGQLWRLTVDGGANGRQLLLLLLSQ